MKWRYDPYQQVATNAETGMRFSVKGPCVDSIEIETANPAAAKCSAADLAGYKQEIVRAVSDEQNRQGMLRLIQTHFRSAYAHAAGIISRRSGHKVSERTIQAWLIEPEKPSSRRCPAWALRALEEHLAENGTGKSTDVSHPIPRPWSAEVLDTKTVGLATAGILSDQRRREEWRHLSFSALADKLFEQEKKVEEWLCHHNDMIHSFESAVRNAKNFDDMKAALLDALSEKRSINFFVRETRKAIEGQKEEFSNDEGLITSASEPQTR